MSTHDSDQLLNYNSRSSILYVAENVIFQLCLCVLPLQLYLTLCDPMNYGPPGSSVHGILQARILEWVAMPSSRGSSWHGNWTCVSHVSCTRRQVLYHYTLLSCCCVRLCNLMDCSPPGSSVYGDSPGKDTGLGCHALLQGIFPTQGLNPALPHFTRILYRLSHQGSPRTLKRVACAFFRGPSQPRNQTGVSCIAGGFFTS